MASKSRFYVDTPRDPSQRHSMFVSHSELAQRQDLSSNSSSATLPSTAGSVDRLTGLEEKKSSRFFTLKPKTSFSLKPFFRSSSSLVSSSPGKRRKAEAVQRRDSYVQTEESRPVFGEVGVQTLNASTVDVPVQTCLEAWEEGDSYGQRRLAYAPARTSPFWSRPYAASSGLSNSLISKNVSKDPLASPKLVKYAAPGDSQKTALLHQSAVSPLNVNSCQSVSPSSSPLSTNVPVKYFSAKELTSSAVSLSVNPQCQVVNNSSKPSVETYENLDSTPLNSNIHVDNSEKKLCNSEIAPQDISPLDNVSEVSDDSKHSDLLSIELHSPISVLKHEKIDSPLRRHKTVHFDLPNPECHKASVSENIPIGDNPSHPRNVDKDFEALLRDLNILTDNESDLQISFGSGYRDKCPTPALLSPTLKSAFDVLKQDFLAPIPEYSNECAESDQINEPEGNVSTNLDKDNKVKDDKEIASVNSSISESKAPLKRSISVYENQNTIDVNKSDSVTSTSQAISTTPLTRSISEYENQNTVDINKSDSVTSTSQAISTTPLMRSISEYENQHIVDVNKSDSEASTSQVIFTTANSVLIPETGSLDGNVYDNVIKEENPVKTVPLPILPSFFEPPSHRTSVTPEIVENTNENSPAFSFDIHNQSAMPLETDFDRHRVSRSSSRSSIRSNSKTGLDAFYEPVNKFDSCENLDQLEEEIIRSLYSPDEGKLDENLMKNIELPPSEYFQNSGTTATHMRRVILDQLLSGKCVEDIVPNHPVYQRTQSVPETGSKYKPAKKYTAVLTKMENDSFGNPSVKHFTPNTLDSSHNSDYFSNANKKKSNGVADIKYINNAKLDSPKKTSVFLFPADKISDNGTLGKSSFEISTSPQQNRGPSVLEVRRSSWTPQPSSRISPLPVNTVEHSISNEEKVPNNKSGQCDFTNCLRPSKIQNSPFLSKINTRSMSPCNFSNLPPTQNSSPSNNSTIKRNDSPAKPPEAVGECDYASCLKPSQVQNSLFTAELTEITAGKSTNSLRAGSPLTVRMNSPLPARCISLDHPNASPVSVEDKTNSQDNESEPVKHKSEFLITLQTATKHSSNKEEKPEASLSPETTGNSPTEVISSGQDSNKSDNVVPQAKPAESVVPPPPPPPPPPSQMPKFVVNARESSEVSMESMIREQKSNLNNVDAPIETRCITPKTQVMAELEKRLQTQSRSDSQRRNNDDNVDGQYPKSDAEHGEISNVGRNDRNLNGSSNNSNGNQFQNGNLAILSSPRECSSSISNGKYDDEHNVHGTKLAFSPNPVVTDAPPPPGAVLLDKKVTVDGDKVHTDKFYAIPVKEVLKEKTSTTKFIPAPPKYEGIGPTEDGIPIGLRNSVKKENMHNWYKTMFKSLHKADSSNDSQEYIIGYTSEPETSRRDMMGRKKASTLDSRLKYDVNSNFAKNYPPSAKSSIEVYNVRPRLIEDYEPGHSSVTDDEVILSRRYLPALNTPKPSYEFKNGYESDTTVTRKREQPEALSPDQQKMWYREVQRGSDIPQFGLGKPAPDKPKEISVGPIPPPPLNYNSQPSHQQAVRPLTLPADYSNQNGNGYCQQMNGAYEMHMRNVIHSEMQHRMSPSSNQLSPPIRTMGKSPSRSPDMKMPAQALFEFKAESPKEIPLKKGDMVLILRQLDKNWYEGEHKGVIGIFPISYVEIVPPEHMSTPVKPRTEGSGRALYDFVAQTSIELTVRKGDAISLIRRVDTNWFEAVFHNKKGIVPVSYIQVLQEPPERSIGSPSPKSYSISPRSESKEKVILNSISPSGYSSSSTSPMPVSQERRKILSKKGSNLIEPIMYRAMYSYSPQNTDELELQEGDSVYVVEMCDDGWFVGTSVRTGVFGIFPGNYVEKACQ